MKKNTPTKLAMSRDAAVGNSQINIMNSVVCLHDRKFPPKRTFAHVFTFLGGKFEEIRDVSNSIGWVLFLEFNFITNPSWLYCTFCVSSIVNCYGISSPSSTRPNNTPASIESIFLPCHDVDSED